MQNDLPVVVSHHQQHVLPQVAKVFPPSVHFQSIVWNLKDEALPVEDLLEHLQQHSGMQKVVLLERLYLRSTTKLANSQ